MLGRVGHTHARVKRLTFLHICRVHHSSKRVFAVILLIFDFQAELFRAEKFTSYYTFILVYLTYNLLPGKDVVRNFFISYSGYCYMSDEKDCSRSSSEERRAPR